MVAFCNIEGEIYKKAKQQAADLTVNDSSEDEDDDEDEDRSPLDRNPMFDLDSDVDLESPFLQNMLSDTRVSPTPEQDATPGATTAPTRSEPTEDDWENI